MTQIKPSSHGIVVEHKESGVRYATTDANYNSNIHRKVRDLKADESIYSYQPKQGPTPTDPDDEQPLDVAQDDSSSYTL